MATLNFPDDPTTGDVYKDGNSGFSYEWNGTVWISTDPSTASNIREIDDISSDFDGSDTTFTLKVAGVNVEPANVQQLIISVGGVMQNAGQDFTLSGSTLTFTTAPSSGLTFFGVLLGTALSLNTVADASVGSASLKTEDFTIGGSGNTVTIPGNLTVQGTETIINTNELNVQDKTIGIGSTNAPTSASQDGAGAIIYGQTHVNILYDVDKAALGINTGVSVAGFVTATGLRSLGVTTCGAGLSLADGVKAQFGDSGELKIYHDSGGQSRIEESGSSVLKIMGSDLRLTNTANSADYIQANDGAAVKLFYNGTNRLETADGGATITGIATADGFSVGNGEFFKGCLYSGDIKIVGGYVSGSDTLRLGENLYLDSNGRFLIGTDTGRSAGGVNAQSQVEGTSYQTSSLNLISNPGATAGGVAHLTLAKSRGSSDGSSTIVADGDFLGTIQFVGADGVDLANIAAHIQSKVDGTPGADDMPGSLLFGTTADGGTAPTERLKITSTGGFQFSNGLFDEKCNITAGKLSDNQDIDLADGMVHYFSTQESTTATPNIRINSSISLQTAMDTGDVCSVTLITTAAAGGYSANLTIDGNAVTEEWVGGSAPAAGSADGLDIYTYTIICIGTGTGDSGFKVIANLTNATN